MVGADADGALIEVTATGDGFDPAGAEWIIERIYRGDSSRTSTAVDSGIGLAIARATVQARDGMRTAFSGGSGTGATIRIRLRAMASSTGEPPGP